MDLHCRAEVLRDFRLTVSAGTGQQQILEALGLWQRNLAAFFQDPLAAAALDGEEAEDAADDPAAVPGTSLGRKKGSSKPRTAALDFTRALNHALRAVDLPLWRFTMGPWRELPLLVLCMDEGSSSYAAVWYLLHMCHLRPAYCTH
jgi:hypothetical protein